MVVPGINQSNWIVVPFRQITQLIFLFLFSLLQCASAFLGFVLFLLLIRLLQLRGWHVLLVSIVTFSFLVVGEINSHFTRSLTDLFPQMWHTNLYFLNIFFAQGISAALYFLYEYMLSSVLCFSFLVAGFLGVMEFIPNLTYERKLCVFQRGQKSQNTEVNPNEITQPLDQLQEQEHEGTVLGISKYSRRTVVISDDAVNQLVLVLGTTGGGKTITLRRFYQRAFLKRYPLIIVDGKPTHENTTWIEHLASQVSKPFYGFNCMNFFHYDPLASGGYTELKDKIISLKDQWESDYYRSIAEDYLQTTFEVLLLSGEPYDLKKVVNCLDYDHLALLVRRLERDKVERLAARVKRLAHYNKKDITGLQAHLSLLIHSELGDYFESVTDKTFSLQQVISENAVVYFALPTLRFPSFSSVLGKLIINDIKAVIDRETPGKRIFTVFDEFSVFAGEQVLNLVNMGRGKGIHAIFGTQGVSDLKKITPEFSNQVLNCVNTLICHRLNDQDSAEAVSGWAGTRETFDLTAQVAMSQGGTGMGSVRRNKEFIVHPDSIKQGLQPGEAFFVSKVGRFKSDKIQVKYS